MNPEAEAELKRILEKDVNDLKEHDLAFIKSRWGYISRNDRKKVEGLLKDKPAELEEVEENDKTEENTETAQELADNLYVDEDSSDEDDAEG